ncbi:diaminopimelate decarboxylase [Haladaptatus paucihalophilus DX253]|uniref:Diaminopimelate decarboxylase n=1 Tax=Haladaptatus paucihalophilus DX253 TaxID=797209 RepID=E7QTE9_HALPU|nr:diaminopimelate decarboxylase [Haladaptatus paucihalophilus]EFW91878.1 diaminopimelate decarboxylase [Haladaptatus paucihalophilus DX253]SHK81881.1 diaminopimelate decarboxylase [Haladaptatus paucihalophilus DX253]
MSATVSADNPPVRRLSDWSDARLDDLADEYDTPLYVIDLERVRENYARLAAAFPDADVHFAAKANTSRAVLETLEAEGASIECASAGETERAFAAGFEGERVHYTAVNPPGIDLDRAVELAADHPGLTVTVGAADTIDRLAERGYDGRLCLRVNPGVGAGHHEKVRTGADAKFGVPYDRAASLLESAADDFDVVGIHAHAGSGISGDDLGNHRELVSRMGELARTIDPDLEFVDVGGGFGVPYHPDDPPLDLESVADATRDALGDLDATLVVEPGRYLVADAGVLLTRVNTVKEAPETTVVGVDAGMTALVRPALYDSYHHIRSVGADGQAVETTVAGPICESSDTFGTHLLADPTRGDLLAVGNAGAYGYEMASQYNSRPRPAVVVVDGDRTGVAHRRETHADVIATETEVTWE